MRIYLTEEQFQNYIQYLKEDVAEARRLPAKAKREIDAYSNNVMKDLFGDKYGTRNDTLSDKYNVEVTNDGELVSGLFNMGNAKLSDDTLIINFTSALGCPSVTVCPVTQKACYAVAGENRLPDVRKKNLKVQNIWAQALKQRAAGKSNAIEQIFSIAELYIQTVANSSKPIKYIRYNEAGDFPTQSILDEAAKFSMSMRSKYNVISMAYTAKRGLDFTKMINGEPIDKIIKINASTNVIKTSPDSIHQNFFATPMDYQTVLANNDNVEEISDAEANILKCKGVTNGKHGNNSVPLLSYGKWSGGEGWYYVCPCSFWKYNKDKAESKFYLDNHLTNVDTTLDKQARLKLRKQIKETNPEMAKKLNSILNKIKSPCGTKCAVCFDMDGGITPDGKIVKDYAVLTATHGATYSNFDPNYANAKRNGIDNVKWRNSDENPIGLDTKFNLPYKQKQQSKQQDDII